jgi:hypothetical protein
MKILSRVPDQTAQLIWQELPEIEKIKEGHSTTDMRRVAVSVFDHWLRDEKEWPLLDCFDGEERRERDRKLLAHWAGVFDLTPAYTVRYRGRWQRKARLVLKQYTSRDGFLCQSRFDKSKSPSQFLILPELKCIYVAGWHDTNVLYFNNREKAQPVLDWALQCGLHVLSFDD